MSTVPSPARPVRGPTRPPGHPDPVRLARAVATAFLEVEAGRRPLRQLLPLLAPAMRLRLQAAVHQQRRRRQPGPDAHTILSVRAEQPVPDAVDAAVVVRQGCRVGAVTVRLERHRGTWRVADVARPEAGRPATRTGSLPWAPPLPDAFDEVGAGDARWSGRPRPRTAPE